MGRRPNLFSQRNMKYYAKKPHALFYALGFSGLVFFPVALMDSTFKGLGVTAVVFGFLFLAIGIIMHVSSVQNENKEIDEQEEPKEQKTVVANKTDFSQYKSVLHVLNGVLDNDTIKKLCNNAKTRLSHLVTYDEYQYSILRVEFNEFTRIAKVTFTGTKSYKTIDRYVQRNHVRYPVYSATKYAHKDISKSIKLTNATLENKSAFGDSGYLMGRFASQIILKLDKPELCPSWLIKQLLCEEKSVSDKRYFGYVDEIKATHKKQIELCENNISIFEEQKILPCSLLDKYTLKLNKLEAKTDKPTRKKAKLQFQIYSLKNDIEELDKKINATKNKISESIKNKDNKIQLLENEHNKAKEIYSILISQVKPLDMTTTTVESFIPMKDISALTYEKIVGCYVIRNKEKDKYYVGQSKDVLRRLKQHFKNAVPHNPIFAEDYYTSAWAEKEDLFEFKIFKLDTKDEMDQKEAELIEQYDAYTRGYNGTHGNKD